MAQFGSGEEVHSFVGVGDFSLSSVGLFVGEGGLSSRGDFALGPASAVGSAGHLTGSMTFTVIQYITTLQHFLH
jgi:hypothetical protein